MLKGPLVTACVAVIALGAVIAAFSANASPYVTIAQAKHTQGDHLHLAGDVVPGSTQMDPVHGTLTFDLKDKDGGTIEVEHHGEMPNNLSEFKKVVAIGGMQSGVFISHQLLIKCPSKYEAGDSGAVARN